MTAFTFPSPAVNSYGSSPSAGLDLYTKSIDPTSDRIGELQKFLLGSDWSSLSSLSPPSASARAVAATWAAGRYADSVCRLRKAGADWLPAPLNDALSLAPSKLKRWSAEALALALPPLRLAKTWGERAARALPAAAPEPRTPPKKRSVAKKRKRQAG